MYVHPRKKRNQYLGQDGQSFINRLLGATSDKPITLPIELPPVSFTPETIGEFKTMAYSSSALIGLGIIGGFSLAALIKNTRK